MSKGLSSVKTLTAKEIAKKWNLSLKDVSKKIAAGVKVEKEHTKSTRQANEIARDHISERPDYYDKLDKMEKTKIVKEMDTSRMPFSKNIEDRRPTTGQDWQSRILKAGSYVSGAIGDIKNATVGPDKPDMNLGKKAEPLNTGRPATSAKEGSTGDGRKEYGRFEGDPRSGEGYRTQTPGSWNKYTDSIAAQGSSGRGTPSPVTPGSKGGSITTPKPPEPKLEPEDVWHGGFNAKAKQPVVKEETGVSGVRGLGYVSGDPSGTNYVEKYVNTNAMSYQDVNGDKLRFIEKSHRKLHDRKLGFKEYDPRSIRTSSNKDLAETNLNELGGDYDRNSQGVDVIGDLTGASRKIAKIDEIKSKLKGRQMKEDKDPCWKGYEMIGMKKKKGRTVPNCVPKEEKNLVPAGSTERGIYEDSQNEIESPDFINTVSRESRFRDPKSLDSVLHVMHNRMGAKGYASSPLGIVRQRGQFAAYGKGPAKGMTDADRQNIIARAKAIFSGSEKDPTGGANEFRTTSAKNRPGGTVIGGNTFYKTGAFAKAQPKTDSTTTTQTTMAPASTTSSTSSAPAPASAPASAPTKTAAAGTDASTFVRKQLAMKETKDVSYNHGRGKIDEDAATIDAMSHMRAPQIERPGYSRPAPTITQKLNSTRTGPARGSLSGQSGSFRPTNLTTRTGTTIQRAAPARPISARMNASQGGSMNAQFATQRAAPMRGITSTMPSRGTGPNAMSAKPTVSGGGLNKSEFMGRSMSSKMTDGLDKVSRGMSKAIAPAAEKGAAVAGSALSKSLGAVARIAGGPAATAAMAVMEPTPAGEKQSEFQRQDMMKKYNPFKSQGRSIADYEKQQVTRKSASAPTAAEAPKPKADVPTPPSRPEYFTRGQAFGAARKEAGGGEGKFSYQSGSDTAPKTYQTNRKDKPEPYKPESQLKQTSVKEETKMNTKELINEALDNIIEDNLVDMKENFMAALQEKAMEKLEERKKIIASDYFAQ